MVIKLLLLTRRFCLKKIKGKKNDMQKINASGSKMWECSMWQPG